MALQVTVLVQPLLLVVVLVAHVAAGSAQRGLEGMRSQREGAGAAGAARSDLSLYAAMPGWRLSQLLFRLLGSNLQMPARVLPLTLPAGIVHPWCGFRKGLFQRKPEKIEPVDVILVGGQESDLEGMQEVGSCIALRRHHERHHGIAPEAAGAELADRATARPNSPKSRAQILFMLTTGCIHWRGKQPCMMDHGTW